MLFYCDGDIGRGPEEQGSIKHQPEDDSGHLGERAPGSDPQGQQQMGVHHGFHATSDQCSGDGGFRHAQGDDDHPRRREGNTQRLVL